MERFIQSKIKLDQTVEQTWKLISTPGMLEQVHPFCKENKVVFWGEQHEKKDLLIYLNGLEYYREFTSWNAFKGYELKIGKEKGKKSRVVWEISARQEKSELKITVFPYESDKILKLIYFWAFQFYIRPRLKRYLNTVLKGIKWHLDKNEKVPRNQFGTHPWFS